MRRLDNLSAYILTTDRGEYCVTMQRIKNNRDGNPRFKAYITTIKLKTGVYLSNTRNTVVYTFTGHYMSEEGEAKWILERYEESVNRRGL